MNENNKPKINMPRPNLTWLYIVIALIFGYLYLAGGDEGNIVKEVSYTEFQEWVSKGYADKVVAYDDNRIEMFVKADHVADVFQKEAKNVGRSPAITVQAGSIESLDRFLDEQQKEGHFTGKVIYKKSDNWFGMLFGSLAPILFFVFIWVFFMRRMGGGAGPTGSGVFNVGKSKAQLFEKGAANRVTFKDVAGQAAAKQEVQEIVDFLKDPQKYTR